MGLVNSPSFDPRKETVLFDDFYGPNQLYTKAQAVITPGGTATFVDIANTSQESGVLRLTSGTAPGAAGQITSPATNVKAGNPSNTSYEEFIAGCQVDIAAGGEDLTFRIGLISELLPAPFVSGCFFMYDSATSPNWLFCAGQGGLITVTNTNIPVVALTPTILQFILIGTEIRAFVNGFPAAVVANDFTIPTQIQTRIHASIEKVSGLLTDYRADLDFYLYRHLYSPPRY